MKTLIPAVLLLLIALPGCTMFTAWKSIPPPGGCDQCHTTEISANWTAGYRAATISDERGQLPFQTPQYNTPIRQGQPGSPLDLKKVEEQQCFVCHTAQTPAHKGRAGRFHH